VNEPDGIAEVFDETIRMTASAVSNARMIAARRREQQFAQQRARDEQETRMLQAQAAAERAGALSELAVVNQREWWDTASPQDVERAWQTAQQWHDREPAAHRATVTLRAEHQRRTGVDLSDRVRPDSQQVREVDLASFPDPAAEAIRTPPPRPPQARKARSGVGRRVEPERQR
jgi:hypothetical protein